MIQSLRRFQCFWLVAVVALVCLPAGRLDAQTARPKLKTYGYFDMEVMASFKKDNAEPWSFDQHHLNLITIYTINDRYRVFTEIEYEHGPFFSESESSGMILLEKAYLEYKHSDALRVRIGKYPSPFGIYNERHDATPTFIATRLPHSVYGKHELASGRKDQLFAKFATGIQVVGDLYSYGWETRYHFYVSNGRGRKPGGADDNSNKGLGGRLVVSPPLANLRLGASYYTDKHGLVNHAEQRSLGVDIEFDLGNLHLESEVLINRSEKVDTTGQPTGEFRKALGYYVMAAYTFGDKVTPFVRYEYSDHGSSEVNGLKKMSMIGINVALTQQVYLKNEVHFSYDHHTDHSYIDDPDQYYMYVGSIAVAF